MRSLSLLHNDQVLSGQVDLTEGELPDRSVPIRAALLALVAVDRGCQQKRLTTAWYETAWVFVVVPFRRKRSWFPVGMYSL